MSDFVHLHLHSHYSVLDGVSQIPDIFKKAHQYGQRAVALTDHGNMFGAMEFYHASQKKDAEGNPLGVKPIYGCELYLDPISRFHKEKKRTKLYHIVLLAQNMTGYRNLLKLSSIAYTEGFRYKPRIDHSLLQEYSEGLIATSACLSGEISHLIIEEREDEILPALDYYIDTFGKERFFLEIQEHGLPEEKIVSSRILELSKQTGLGVVATNDVHYISQEDAKLQEIMFATRDKRTLSDPNRYKYDTDQFYFKSTQEMEQLFSGVPEALSNTVKISEMVDFDLEFDMHLPQYKLPEKETAPSYLATLCQQGMQEKFENDIPQDYIDRLERELAMIEQMGFSNYFLVVYDFVNYARRKGILVGPGRGSAAGAMVAYTLGITNIDPIRYGLLFERFLNPERVSMPDIDIDFQDDRRDEVKEYIRSYYGYDKTADVITFGIAKSRAALKDVGRAMEIPLDFVNRMTKLIDNRMANKPLRTLIEDVPELKQIQTRGTQLEKEWLEYSARIDGTIRNLGTHASALIISQDILTDVVPLYLDKRSNVISTQYDGHYLEENGLLKMDILGLSTLTLIHDCLDRIQHNYHITIDMDRIPIDDQKVFHTLSRGETMGIFQFESAGMTEYLKQLKPNSIDDLIAMNALYRPGPMDNIPTYIARKQGREPVDTFHEKLADILKPTYGVIVYQEQVMQIAQVLAGFSLGKADILRRAMAKKKIKELDKMRPEWVNGAVERGFKKELAEHIFELLIPFSNYAFNKSHSAAYSVVAYQTAYLKTYYYKEFMASLLSLNMSSSDDVRMYVMAFRAKGLEVLPPDINHSYWDFVTEGDHIRFGLGAIKGMGEAVVDCMVHERQIGGPYADFENLVDRLMKYEDFKKSAIEILIKAGAFDTFYEPEKLMQEKSILHGNLDAFVDHTQSSKKEQEKGQLSLFGDMGEDDFSMHINRTIPPLSLEQEFKWETSVFGFYYSGKVFKHYERGMGKLTSYSDSLLTLLQPGTGIITWGFISDLMVKNAESKRAWAVFTLDTGQDSIRLFLFSDKFQRFQARLQNDSFVMVKLVTSMSDRGARYEVADIQIIAAASQQKYTELHVFIEQLEDQAAFHAEMMQFKELAIQHSPGQVRLIFHTLQNGAPVTIQGSTRYRVKMSHELLNAVAKMEHVKSYWVY